MIVISKLMEDFIQSQTSIDGFAEKLGVSRQTVYNILKKESISSEMMSKLLNVTGITLDKAFEVAKE